MVPDPSPATRFHLAMHRIWLFFEESAAHRAAAGAESVSRRNRYFLFFPPADFSEFLRRSL